jgi:outer membrane protein assembly factor BamB
MKPKKISSKIINKSTSPQDFALSGRGFNPACLPRFLILIILLNLFLVACSDKTTPLPNELPSPPPETGKGDWAMPGYNAYLHAQNPDFTTLSSDNAPQLGLQWQYNAEMPLAVSPAVVGNTIYLNNGQGKLIALDKQNATPRWTYEYKGASQTAPVVAEGKVFLATTSGQVTAVKAADGKPLWQKEFGQPTLSDPVYQDKTLYLNRLLTP